MTAADPALETLLLPIHEGLVAWPADGGLFLNAREGWPLRSRPLPGLVCQQDFRPAFDALQRAGFEVAQADDDRRFDLVMLLPPRQREQARALYALALTRLAPGGVVLACQANSEGAKSAQDDLARLAGPLEVRSKYKCRVFWGRPGDGADLALRDAWLALDAPRVAVEGRFLSRPGVFAWDRVDAASALLAAQLPPTLSGRAADLGAGYGYLADALLRRCPGITALDAFEADARAAALCRDNLAAHASRAAIAVHWHDVTQGVPGPFDVIVCNPPFHAQVGAERPDIGRRFIEVAAAALRPGGALWLVANRHLPYEQALASGFGTVRAVVQQGGFKVVEAVRAQSAGRP